MALFFYRCIYLVALLPMLLRLLYRGIKQRTYWQRISERFGYLSAEIKQAEVWIHAVSVGEVKAAVILIQQLRQQKTDLQFFVTTTTPTGSAQLQRELGNGVGHSYLPYDVSYFYAAIFRRVKPQVLIIMETEVWANLILKAKQQHVPVVLANARLSKKSARGYATVSCLSKLVFSQFSVILAQQKADARRFRFLTRQTSVKPQIQVVGNIKFEQPLADDILPKGAQLRYKWGADKQVIALASSHTGEEMLLLQQFKKYAKENTLLMLIPRHPERFNAVFAEAKNMGFHCARRSDMQLVNSQTQVFLADSMSEMLLLLAACDVAIIGGSLLVHGGHNPIEPAALAKPVLIGPNYHNFQAIGDALIKAKAMQVVMPEQALTQAMTVLQEQKAHAMGQAGQQFVAQNSGSGALMCKAILPLIS